MSIITCNVDGLNTTLKDKDYQNAYNMELKSLAWMQLLRENKQTEKSKGYRVQFWEYRYLRNEWRAKRRQKRLRMKQVVRQFPQILYLKKLKFHSLTSYYAFIISL